MLALVRHRVISDEEIQYDAGEFLRRLGMDPVPCVWDRRDVRLREDGFERWDIAVSDVVGFCSANKEGWLRKSVLTQA